MKKIPFDNENNFTTADVINRNSEINNIDDVKNFINDCLTVLNLNFHPDDNFNSYTKYATNTNMFSDEEAEQLNTINDKCFEICEKYNEDYYDLCFNIFNNLNGNIFGGKNEIENTTKINNDITNEYFVLNIDYNNFKKGDTFIKKGNNLINENGQLLVLPVNELLNIFSTSQTNNGSTYKPNRIISAQRGDNGNFNWVNYQKNFKGNSIGVTTKVDVNPTTIDTNSNTDVNTNVNTETAIDLQIGEGYKFLNVDNNILRVKYIGVSESNKNELLFKHSILKDVIKVNKENIKNLIIK